MHLSPEYIGLAIVVLVGIIAHARSTILARRKRQLFQRRESLSPQEVLGSYYANTGLDMTVVLSIWQECARHLEVPVDKLRPTDRFDRELAPADFIASLNDPRDHLARYASRYAKDREIVIDLKTPATIDDLIRQLAIGKSR